MTTKVRGSALDGQSLMVAPEYGLNITTELGSLNKRLREGLTSIDSNSEIPDFRFKPKRRV